MFMEAQGYEIGSNIIFQDNKSAILLARNGIEIVVQVIRDMWLFVTSL